MANPERAESKACRAFVAAKATACHDGRRPRLGVAPFPGEAMPYLSQDLGELLGPRGFTLSS